MHEEGKSMLFIFMCVHEYMKKIPARPLLIEYGIAGMRVVLSRIDSGVSGSPFLVLRPPFLVLTQEKEAKESQAPNRGQGSWPGAPGVPAKLAGYMIEMIVHPAFIFHFSFSTSPLAR